MVYENVKDADHQLPFASSFRQCPSCATLWMDPRPSAAFIPALYPTGYYPHVAGAPLLGKPSDLAQRVRYSLKLAILAYEFGYSHLLSGVPSRAIRCLGRWLRKWPRLRKQVGHIIRFLRCKPGGRLLDVGCGAGAYLDLMRDLGWKVGGIEPDPRAAEVAARRGHAVTVRTAEEAELQPESYDAVTLCHVLEHVPDPSLLLGRLMRAVKPGGYLVSISPNPVSWAARRFKESWRALDPPRHLVLISPAGCRGLMSRAEAEVSTFTMQYAGYATIAQSISIRRTGRVYDYASRFLPHLLDRVVRVSMLLNPENGDEVVLIARKR
jgi:2-polyprenyl-3-methyl-5-hydroxy-6-metoxy-1,4-benzoquinol methylase